MVILSTAGGKYVLLIVINGAAVIASLAYGTGNSGDYC